MWLCPLREQDAQTRHAQASLLQEQQYSTTCALQDVTKQQAKERAAARRLVAGQSTLDKYLSPASKAVADKQVQKQMAKASKAGKAAEPFKQSTAARKKRVAASEVDKCNQEGLKRPRRQMVRLYPDLCSPEAKPARSKEAQLKQYEQAEPADDNDMDCGDADFQPAKKRVQKPTGRLKLRASKNAAPRANAECAESMQGGEVVKQTASFQDYSFSRTKAKPDVEVFSNNVVRSNGSTPVSARQPAQTSQVYNGLY